MKLFLGSLALLLGAAGISFLLLRFGQHEHNEAHYLCLKCGHGEVRIDDGHEVTSTMPEEIDSVFSKRFGAALPPDHTHDWMTYGCVISERGYAYTGDEARDWIEILPRLADIAGSEALFRGAIGLTPEQRRDLIYSFLRALGGDCAKYDEEFARWSSQRRLR